MRPVKQFEMEKSIRHWWAAPILYWIRNVFLSCRLYSKCTENTLLLRYLTYSRFLSEHGRCYSFDSRADGFGRGEGVAAIVLKPLNAAIRDNDPIQAVIRGSAVNSDGRTPGITMPSKSAQVKMMRLAYAKAGLDPTQTVYIEAHGTTTYPIIIAHIRN